MNMSTMTIFCYKIVLRFIKIKSLLKITVYYNKIKKRIQFNNITKIKQIMSNEKFKLFISDSCGHVNNFYLFVITLFAAVILTKLHIVYNVADHI